MPALSICYLTSRLDPKIEWFLDYMDIHDPACSIKVIVVDFFADQRTLNIPRPDRILHHTVPKPTVWQGKHRFTKEDWFAASNGRNTALLLCPDGYIAYIDDLSIPSPDWLNRVRLAHTQNYTVFGSYKKVKNLVVDKGRIVSFTDFATDNRLSQRSTVGDCSGEWLYGCSLAGNVNTFLSVGGWPELCDGLGFEDCIMGIALGNRGHNLKYDPAMLTYESEELHHVGPVFKRSSKEKHPHDSTDKGHRALELARRSKNFPNHFDGGIAKVRQDCLAGKPFPIPTEPQVDWHDGQLLKDMV